MFLYEFLEIAVADIGLYLLNRVSGQRSMRAYMLNQHFLALLIGDVCGFGKRGFRMIAEIVDVSQIGVTEP